MAVQKMMMVLFFLAASTVAALSSSECVALTWEEVEDRGNNVYRLPGQCRDLFECPAGSYCPAGAITKTNATEALAYFREVWSENVRCGVIGGFLNSTFSYACDCGFGFWCAANTALPRFCPKGFYCRLPATLKDCKKGHYCKEGSVFGRRCTRLQRCPRKSPRPKGGGGALIIFLVLILLAFCGFRIYEALKEKQRDRANQEMEDYLETLRDAKTEKKWYQQVSIDHEVKIKKNVEKESINIEFKDMWYVLPNGVTIVRGVCGEFKGSRTCAIMGASGAGKTTMMNLVLGKVKKTRGQIFVNGKDCETIKYNVGFVPQDDIMHRRLTVLQNINFSAYLRLPNSMPKHQKHQKINKTLVSLNLDKIKHSIIGDDYKRGISGGQRKRVNVALELVADPQVLFMDEPTSGLDSVSATELCQMLRTLAENDSLTIAAVIHSPGPAAFAAFHDLLLLQTGGRPVYAGPMSDVEHYFATIGFRYDRATDQDPLADYIMKAIGGLHTPNMTSLKTDDDKVLAEFYDKKKWDPVTGFTKLWRKKTGQTQTKKRSASFSEKVDSRIAHGETRASRVKAIVYEFLIAYPFDVARQLCPSRKKDRPHSLQIFLLCFQRACRQVYVNFTDFLLSSVVVFFAMGAFAAAVSPSNLNVLGGYPVDICQKQYPDLQGKCLDLQQNSYVGALQFVGFVVVAANSAIASATFGGPEQPIYWREASTTLNTPAYFFAKVLADAPVAVVHALAVSAGFLTGFVSPMSFGALFAPLLLVTCFGYLSGYFLSFTLPYGATGLAGVGWALFWMLLFGGTTKLMSDNRSTRWVWALSPGRYANEAWFHATTVYPYEQVRRGPQKGEPLFDMQRQKQDYLFFHNFHEATSFGFLTLLVLLFIDLILITATKLDKKR